MKLLVEMTDEEFKTCKFLLNAGMGNSAIKRILEGTPLPKGHGRLIDADALLSKAKFLYKGYEIALTNIIGDTPTIIEADKEGAEE